MAQFSCRLWLSFRCRLTYSANAQAGVGYAIGQSTDLNLSWRYQGQRWTNGAVRSNGFTSDQNGLELGIKVYF